MHTREEKGQHIYMVIVIIIAYHYLQRAEDASQFEAGWFLVESASIGGWCGKGAVLDGFCPAGG